MGVEDQGVASDATGDQILEAAYGGHAVVRYYEDVSERFEVVQAALLLSSSRILLAQVLLQNYDTGFNLPLRILPMFSGGGLLDLDELLLALVHLVDE